MRTLAVSEPMDYRTVFDIADEGYKSWSAHGLIFVAIGCLIVAFRERLSDQWSERPRQGSAFAFLFLGFAILWTLVDFWGTYSEYADLRDALSSGKASIVEGRVSQFKPMPVTGHAMERFCVETTCFEYSDFVATNGFNNTKSHGGPVREGLPVRVTYVGSAIVKLEVGRQGH